MIIDFHIATTQFINQLRAGLENEFKILTVDDIEVNVSIRGTGNPTLLYCELKCGEKIYSEQEWRLILSNIVAGAVSENIINYWEEDIVKKIIYENYYYLDHGELRTIEKSIVCGLKASDGDPDNYATKMYYRSRIYYKLASFLKENDHLDVKGFICFRLRDYLDMLYDAVDDGVEEYMLEKEYHEFIDLLRNLTGLHEIKKEEVHVVFKTERCVKLLDESLLPIKCDYLDGFTADTYQEDKMIYDDLLVCVLIAISPRKIVLHYKSEMYPTVLCTLKKVFPARVMERIY